MCSTGYFHVQATQVWLNSPQWSIGLLKEYKTYNCIPVLHWDSNTLFTWRKCLIYSGNSGYWLIKVIGGGMTKWVVCQTHNRLVMSLSPIKGSRCFLGQETLLSLLSPGWFQEQIWAWFTLTKLLISHSNWNNYV